MGAYLKFSIDPVREADKLSTGLRNRVIRIAMNKASARVRDAVVGRAPALFGYLKKSFRIKVKNYRNSNTWVAVVGPKSDFKKSKGKYTRGEKKGQPIVRRPSKYAHLVERGTRHSKPKPYLKPALDATVNVYRQVLTDSIRTQVAQLLP